MPDGRNLGGRPRKKRLSYEQTADVREILNAVQAAGVRHYQLSIKMGKPSNWLTKRIYRASLDAVDDEAGAMLLDDALLVLEFVGTRLAETSDRDDPRIVAFLVGSKSRNVDRIEQLLQILGRNPKDAKGFATVRDDDPFFIEYVTKNGRNKVTSVRRPHALPSRNENPKLWMAAAGARQLLSYLRACYNLVPKEPDLSTVAGIVRDRLKA